MITTLIGKTFLKAYNEKLETQYEAKEFFEEVFFEKVFNHSKYLMSGGNSPLENPKISWMRMLNGNIPYESSERRKERLLTFTEKATDTGSLIDASMGLGYPASKITATTSGLVSDIDLASNEEDIYFSWFGGALGIGVAGGYNILLDEPNILLEIFEGWKYYRKYLNDSTLEKLKGNQINSWNGQWLTYKLGNHFREDFLFRDLELEKVFKVTDKLIEVNTVNWSNLFFSLSNKLPDKTLSAYIYSLGQTNKTIGFIPIHLKSGNKLIEVNKQLYGTTDTFDSREFQALFGRHIKRACELGSIGLQALRPKGLTKYFNSSKNFTFNREQDLINYQSYKIWLIAMMTKNKEEVTDYTMEIAALILRYRGVAKGTTGKNLIEKELLAAGSKRYFLEALSAMVEALKDDDLEALKKLRNEVHLMTNEEFVYFNTLLKFDYKYLEKQS